MERKIKVLVVDDTATYRAILSGVFEGIEGVEVVGIAQNGKIALDKVALLKPDLVTLDMEMPVINGLGALRCLSKSYPDTGVVMVSAASAHSADQTIEALSLGCLDFIVKPLSTDFNKAKEELSEQITRVLNIFCQRNGKPLIKVLQQPVAHKTVESSAVAQTAKPKVVDVVLIGSSTGGPKALENLIPKLPAYFSPPVLIVQHMPPLFTSSLAKSLNDKSAVTVKEGKDCEDILPGHVYIAPGGEHMTVRKTAKGAKGIKLDNSPPENSCRPSVDKLFRSAVDAYLPQRSLCVILTGMGQDGTKGVQYLREKGGGYCLAQSEESCVVYGMPRSIVEAGLDSEKVNLKDMAASITEICC